jgi:predicted nucleic acid-binding protein
MSLLAGLPVMVKPCFVFDSNILISHLNKALDVFSFIETLPDCDVYINRVVEIETLARPGMTAEEEAVAKLLLSGFKRADFTDAMRDEAARIRRDKTLLLPDAVIAATAIILNATVLSNDPHLRDYQRSGYAALPIESK